MARKTRNRALANRALARIERKGIARATEIAQFICDEIATNPDTPEDHSADRQKHNPGPHLRYSFYVDLDPTGDAVIKTRRRYWAFVEFGTRRRDYKDEQPFVRPAVELARQVFR